MSGEDFTALIAQHGSKRAAARALGLSETAFRRRLKRSGTAVPRVTVGHSLDEFRAQFDKATIIPAKIRAGLQQLGGGWMYEVDFSHLAGVSMTDLGHYRDAFAEHVLVVRSRGRGERRVWAGTPASAEKMRAML